MDSHESGTGIEGNLWILLQVNCRSILSKSLDFYNLVHSTLVWQTTKTEEERMTQTSRKTEEVTSDEWVATRGAQRIKCISLVLLQVNCRSILNKSSEFWNLVDTYNADVIIGTEPWLREEISNAEVFGDDYTTFMRDRNTQGVGVFTCIKDYTACAELWVDEDFKMIAAEVKGMDPEFTWGIVGVYRAPNEDM
jgi:hypothetical protein